MRRIVAAAAAIVFFTAIPAIAAPEFFTWWRTAPVDQQSIRVDTTTRTTTSTEWKSVGGFGPSDGLIIDTRNGLSVTMSVQLSGAPAEFRISTGQSPYEHYKVMGPGPVRFDPLGGTNSFSFVFAKDATSPGPREMIVQWRSPTGGATTLEKISVLVITA
jgi:hypothetical protein